jgi:hypothetical protein
LRQASNPIDGFKYIFMLDADLNIQLIPLVLQIVSQPLLVNIQGDVHLVDHDIAFRFVAAPKDRSELGHIDVVGCQQGGDVGHKALAVGAAGRDDEGLAVAGGPGDCIGAEFADKKMELKICRVGFQGLTKGIGRALFRSRRDEDAGELILQDRLADVFDIEILLKEDPVTAAMMPGRSLPNTEMIILFIRYGFLVSFKRCTAMVTTTLYGRKPAWCQSVCAIPQFANAVLREGV